jgi:hypothetical protein
VVVVGLFWSKKGFGSWEESALPACDDATCRMSPFGGNSSACHDINIK